jgi:hypothetical protein
MPPAHALKVLYPFGKLSIIHKPSNIPGVAERHRLVLPTRQR